MTIEDSAENKVEEMPEDAVVSRRLPAEIMLEILGYALALPNGIHSERFETIKKIRVDRMSAINKSYPNVVSEALYKHNKVIIKPRHPKKMSELAPGPAITYPTVQQSKFVRQLEFVTSTGKVCETDPEFFLECQSSWLNDLASGELGFQNLDILRLSFRTKDEYCSFFAEFVEILEGIGPLRFKAKTLEIIIDGKNCTADMCTCNPGECNYVHRLVAMLLVQPPN
jgi:hypothetical protein